ncbi:MAG: hypothetical protein ABSE82_04390 [Nitrososphaerales archaeon]|jgi:hypothetical protein
MRMAYGEGVVVAILLPFVLFLLGVVSLSVTLFLCLIFFGVWTLISAFLLARKVERNFFLTWGLIISCASTIFVIQLSYAIALILIAIIASVFIYVSARKTKGSTVVQTKQP